MSSGRWMRSLNKRLLPMSCRLIIWDEAVVMLGESVALEGASGLACKIFESYLRALPVVYTEEWRTVLDNLKDHFVLHIAICLQLAAKMISRSLDSTKLHKYLQHCGLLYSISEINEVERNVFKTIGFQLPLHTTEEEAGTLAHDVGLSARAVEMAGLLAHLAELNLPILLDLVDEAWTAAPTPTAVPGNSSLNTPEVKQLMPRELLAGTVLAARLYLPCERSKDGTQVLSQLARWASVEPEFVQCIADCILKSVMNWMRCKWLARRGDSIPDDIPAKKRRLNVVSSSSS